MLDAVALITKLHDRFKARDAEGALALLHPEVAWATEAGEVLAGRAAVRAHWEAQWAETVPILLAERFEPDGLGRLVITGRLRVRDRTGTLLADGPFTHAYTIEAGLIRRLERAGFRP